MPRLLYAPALPVVLLRSLHRVAQARKQPMTRLLAEFVREGLPVWTRRTGVVPASGASPTGWHRKVGT